MIKCDRVGCNDLFHRDRKVGKKGETMHKWSRRGFSSGVFFDKKLREAPQNEAISYYS